MHVSIRTGGTGGRLVIGRRMMLGGDFVPLEPPIGFESSPGLLILRLVPTLLLAEELTARVVDARCLLLPGGFAKGWVGGPTIPG